MKMIVGLGNPGKEYEKTRHNVGFMIVDNYLKKENMKNRFNGLYIEKNINDERVIFLKPQSFMNLSGTVVTKYAKYFKIPFENILIIRDDLDLKIGTAKIKFNSSSGGDNGVKSIIEELNTKEFYQFKIGISNNKDINAKDYVLSKFSKAEELELNKIINISSEIIDYFIVNGGKNTINNFNGILK